VSIENSNRQVSPDRYRLARSCLRLIEDFYIFHDSVSILSKTQILSLRRKGRDQSMIYIQEEKIYLENISYFFSTILWLEYIGCLAVQALYRK